MLCCFVGKERQKTIKTLLQKTGKNNLAGPEQLIIALRTLVFFL